MARTQRDKRGALGLRELAADLRQRREEMESSRWRGSKRLQGPSALETSTNPYPDPFSPQGPAQPTQSHLSPTSSGSLLWGKVGPLGLPEAGARRCCAVVGLRPLLGPFISQPPEVGAGHGSGMKQPPTSDSFPPGGGAVRTCPQPPLCLLLFGDKLGTEGHRTVSRAGQREGLCTHTG